MNARIRLGAAAALLAGALCAPLPAQARAGAVWINPGIKLAYTLGEGFTYGFELSAVFMPPSSNNDTSTSIGAGLADLAAEWSHIWGIVFNIDRTTSRVTKLRLGAEWVGPGIGIEAGPTLILDAEGRYFGIGVTPWTGFYTMPYYTYTFAFGRKNLHELGMYLKLYRCVNDAECGRDGDPSSLD